MNSLLFLSICVFFLLLAGDLHLIQADDDDSHANFLRLPGSEIAASAPTNIVGRDGLCLDVTNNTYVDGTPIQLWPCTKNRNQLWTFESDGTIRSNGKCMTTSGNSIGSYAMIYECNASAPHIRAIWSLNYLGTITNFFSGLVLSSLNATAPEGLPVTLAINENLPFQAWTTVNYTIPVVNYISSGFNGHCLNAENPKVLNSLVYVRCCVMRQQPRQQWALYGDKTIRLFSDRSLCVTSAAVTTGSLIRLNTCQGLRTQRWNFLSDAYIFNPFTGFYMNLYSSLAINIVQQTVTPRQEWYTLACPDCPYITL